MVSSATRTKDSVMSNGTQAPAAAGLRLENRHTGEVLTLRRQDRNGEAIIELRGTLPPHRDGPPMHIHFAEDEDGVVVAGKLSAELDGKRIEAGPGEPVHLPRGVPHRWWNDGDKELEFEGIVHPAVDFD